MFITIHLNTFLKNYFYFVFYTINILSPCKVCVCVCVSVFTKQIYVFKSYNFFFLTVYNLLKEIMF